MSKKSYEELLNDAQEIVLGAITSGREMTSDESNRSQNMVAEAKELKRNSSGYDALVY